MQNRFQYSVWGHSVQTWGLNRHESLGGQFIHSRYMLENCGEAFQLSRNVIRRQLFYIIKIIQFSQVWKFFLPMCSRRISRPGGQGNCTMDNQKKYLVLNIFIIKKAAVILNFCFIGNIRHNFPERLPRLSCLFRHQICTVFRKILCPSQNI